MVYSMESFIDFTLSGGPNTHMGGDSKIPILGRCSIKIQHDELNNVLYVPSPAAKQTVQDEEEAKSSTKSIRIEESLLGVTPSPVAPKVYEISDISSPHIADQ